MASNIITRVYGDDRLELRGSIDERIIAGIAVPFDTPALIHGEGAPFEEIVKRGAFSRTIVERGGRVKLLDHHNRRNMPLGRAVLLEERREGLYAEFRVSRTQAGDEALELVRDGSIDSFSIGFRPVAETWSARRDKRTLTEISLSEASLVNFPAYENATITGTRASGTRTIPVEQIARRLRVLDTLTYEG